MKASRKTANEFGDQTYWNRPTQSRQRKLPSKYTNIKSKIKTNATSTRSRSPSPTGIKMNRSSRSTSPTPSHVSSASTIVSPFRSAHTVAHKSKEEEDDDKDEKSIVKIMKSKLPQFSNEADWEISIFELSLVLDRVWPHKDQLDIIDYMTTAFHRRSMSGDMEERADRLIYFALTMSAKKDSYAKTQIMASCHKDAVPCVMKNEGKKLYQMFQAMFTMTNLHQASLPTVRTEFYSISQRENESILKYTARVDMIVATMAKLGERVSSGAWIYALGNGLRTEFKECKDGILYSKNGYNTVLEVKTKLLSEEAVLTSQSKKAAPLPNASSTTQDDEIALASLKITDTKKPHTAKTPLAVPSDAQSTPKDKALWLKGKHGKNHPKGKGSPKGRNRQWDNEWTSPDFENDRTQWNQSSKGKGRGKGYSNMDQGKGFDSQQLWCDIHQRYGHSTDWCYENPHRTGGKPPLWCDLCNRSGHTANSCYATSIRVSPKGKGSPPTKGGKGKGHHGDRSWKSQNFPANYHSEQATPTLHDETPSTDTQEWRDGTLTNLVQSLLTIFNLLSSLTMLMITKLLIISTLSS